MKYSIVFLTVLGTLCLSPSNAADLKCKFQYHKDEKTGERSAYTCINDQELPEGDSTVTNVIGDHLYKDELKTKMFTNVDVEIVQIESIFITEIPKKLIKFFPKMTKLSVTPKLYGFNQDAYKDVFDKLKKLEISVDYLPDNVFDGLVNLQELSLMRSGLTTLPPMLFDKLLQLEVIKVHGRTGAETDLVSKLDQLPANLFKNNKQLRDISFHHNGLTCIHDGLFEGLDKLKSVSLDNPCINADLSTTESLSLIKNKIHVYCRKCGVEFNAIAIPPPVVCPAVPGPNDPKECHGSIPTGFTVKPPICPTKPGPNDPPGCHPPIPTGPTVKPPICPTKPGPNDPPACHPVSPVLVVKPPVCPTKPGPNDPPGCPRPIPTGPTVKPPIRPISTGPNPNICPAKPGPNDPPGCVRPISTGPTGNPSICPTKPGPNDPPACFQSCYKQLNQLQEEYIKLKAQKNCNSKSSLELVFKHKQNQK